MPDLVEQMYCSQQIFIPPNLPSILKKYAKAAIRTQPGDLLIWSSAYFKALATGIPPPAKGRIEYPPVNTPSGLSPGFLKVLINQIGKGETVSKDILEERWRGVCLSAQAFQDLLAVGMFSEDVNWLEFLAICAGTLQPSLTRTMIQLCELLTEEPEGGSAAIPVSTFLNLYKYLAKLDCGPVNTLEQYEKTLREDSETQCIAEALEPQEEEVQSGVPNIDWDTAIEDGSIEAGNATAEATEESSKNPEESENPVTAETEKTDPPAKDLEDSNNGIETEEVSEDNAAGEEADGDGIQKEADINDEETEREMFSNDGSDKTKDAAADSEGASNGGDSGVASTDEGQDPKGEVKDEAGASEETEIEDEKTGKEDETPSNVQPGHTTSQEQDEEIVKISNTDVDAIPAERTDSEDRNGQDVPPPEGSKEDSTSLETPDSTEPNEPCPAGSPIDQSESISKGKDPDAAEPEEAVTAESKDEPVSETPESPEAVHTEESTDLPISADTTDQTAEENAPAESEVETTTPAVEVESAEPIDGDMPADATGDDDITPATEAQQQEPAEVQGPAPEKDEDTSPEELKNPEPMLNIGSVYIIDDDGTLSAAPRPLTANGEGDLQERDSDKTIATNPSDVGMMVWPEIKPEKEEIEEEPQMEKEVTSEDGIEVLTEVDIQPTQEEIKMIPVKSEELQAEGEEHEEDIFAPQIDSFTDLLDAESGPVEELSPEELAAVESFEGINENETTTHQVESVQSRSTSEVQIPSSGPKTESMQPDGIENASKPGSERKPKHEENIESLVKKDSEMMLLPTPVTSDIMLYVDNECEKSTFKVSTTQQLTNKMSLVDVQVAVPIDETVVEVVERHQYPKWMNIPGIGPVVPDHIVEEAEKYFQKVAELQEGMVMPRNIKHFHCPPLEMIID